MVYLHDSIYRNPVSCLGDDLFNFLERSHYSAHLRDTKTNKYIFGNAYATKNIGLASQNAIVGMTPDEVIAHRLHMEHEQDYLRSWGEKLNNLLGKTYSLSKKVLYEQTQMIQRDIELSIDGFIRITQTIRSPIFNSRKEIVAIASVDYDFARQCRLLELFHLYQRYLPQDKSVKHFLRFLDIDHYFREFPTITELMIILSMCENESVPFICDCTKLTPQLVEQNKASLQTKFFNFDLTHLLINLRTRHESNFELWD